MKLQELRDRSIMMQGLHAAGTPPNISYGEGFLVHDDYDLVIFDDLLREFPLWNRITKHEAVGDFTNGFLQSALGAARMVDKTNIAFSATTATRSAHTPQEIKAITSDRTFGVYKRSVYASQGNRYGDLTQKDIGDIYTSIFKVWADKAYNGTVLGDPLDFDGLKILCGSGTDIAATTSVTRAIEDAVLAMINSSTKRVRPTAVYTNSVVAHYIMLEQRKAGDKLVVIGDGTTKSGEPVAFVNTAAGRLPVFGDPFNGVVAGTPNTYPTFILSEDKLRWEFIPVLGQQGAEPKVFEFPQETSLDQKYKGIMFGALDGDGFSSNVHHARLNIGARTTIVDPSA